MRIVCMFLMFFVCVGGTLLADSTISNMHMLCRSKSVKLQKKKKKVLWVCPICEKVFARVDGRVPLHRCKNVSADFVPNPQPPPSTS